MDSACSRRAPSQLGIALEPRIIPTATSPLHTHVPPLQGLLIGREHELVLLNQLLTEPTTRLITICGIGGIGKTWLALAVAATQLATLRDGSAQLNRSLGGGESPVKRAAHVEATRFPHGVCFVDLRG